LRPRLRNRVRIIGGAFRGRRIAFPTMEDLRPTPDRVRETVFNWLGQDLAGRRTLDLYAGSGALTLEAASRGAALAVAVDRSRTLIGALRANAQALGATAVEAHVGDARHYVTSETRSFDVVFLDPPFRDDPWDWLLPACAARLLPDGVIYAEASHELAPTSGIAVLRHAQAGQVHYHLLGRGGAALR
jgi:16S rRNA (guanine966-N2)-methyltransferase